MKVEIDQSGKFEQLDTHTVVACTNEESAAIRISASVKRNLVRVLRKSIVIQRNLYPVVFAILVFLVLNKMGSYPSVIVIDEEYTRKDRVIRETLKKLLHRRSKGKWKGQIRFEKIGKSSPAHQLAWKLHRFREKDKLTGISEKDVLEWWQ